MTARQEKPKRENIIEVRGLLSQFGDRVIHQDLNLDVRRGEVLGVVGGSGTGKTVLLNSILGLKQPEGGSIKLFGYERDLMTKAEAAEVERRTGVLFQQGALFSALTVAPPKTAGATLSGCPSNSVARAKMRSSSSASGSEIRPRASMSPATTAEADEPRPPPCGIRLTQRISKPACGAPTASRYWIWPKPRRSWSASASPTSATAIRRICPAASSSAPPSRGR